MAFVQLRNILLFVNALLKEELFEKNKKLFDSCLC